LLLSLSAVVTAAQQKLVIEALLITSGLPELERTKQIILRCDSTKDDDEKSNKSSQTEWSFAAKNMLYVWQCPTMFMSYAWLTFLVALSVHVCTPLIRSSGPDDDTKVRSK